MMEDPMLPSSPQRRCAEVSSFSCRHDPKQDALVECTPRHVNGKPDALVGDTCEQLQTIAYDDIGATSGAPIEFLQIQQHDELSQVSTITPSTAGSFSCNFIDKDQTEKPRDIRFVADAAICLMDRISGFMHDLAESIDPNVLEEWKDRTRSMLSKSWGMALDDLSTPKFTRVPSSIFTNEKQLQTREQGAFITTHKSSLEKKKKTKKDVRSPCQRKELHHQQVQNISPSHRPLHCSNVKGNLLSFVDQHQDIEVTEEDGIIDCNQLGQEVEISIHQNEFVLLCRDMAIEVKRASNDHVPSTSMIHPTDPGKDLVVNADSHDFIIVHSWKMSPRRSFSKRKSMSFSGECFSRDSQKTFKHGRSRGSGKTVSTVVSEESSSTLQTDGTRWIRDAISGILLDQ